MKTTDDELDATLRAAMSRRPEPPDATNLASRAVALARAERRFNAAPRGAAVARRLSTLAAAAATLAVLLVGRARLGALPDVEAASSSYATVSAGEIAPTLAVGGIGLLVAVGYVTSRATLAADDEDDAFA